MMGWLIRYEAYPAWFTHTVDGYRSLFDGGELFLESWMKILLKGQPIGFSHTQIEMDGEDARERYRMRNRTAFEFAMMGERQFVQMRSEAGLDERYRLQRFEVTMNSRRYAIEVEGRRAAGEQFDVRIHSPAGSQKLQLNIPDDVIVYSPMTELAMRSLRPGDHLRMKTLDPLSMTTADVVVKALRKEMVATAGGREEATVLAITLQGMDLTTWLARDGRVLRQETPYAWVMEACTAQEAARIDHSALDLADLLTTLAVPVRGRIEDPLACRALQLRVRGLRFDPSALDSPRQRVSARDSNDVTFALTRPTADGARAALAEPARYLASTPFIQSDDPRLRRAAQNIVGEGMDDAAKARAIHDWVYKNVSKTAAATLPSALDVLKRLEGDCNEHTYLSVALARAAGLPAQVRVGLVYKDGAFYYHAWPAFYVGYWLETDPTWGQEVADLTHLALLEGELGEQMPLMGTLGKLEVEVVSQTY